MFRIMGLENSEDWMNPVHHTEQVIKQARAFFDSWLDRFPGWSDFVKGVENNTLPEFGGTGENAIRQVSDWLGGAAEAAHSYSYIVKYRVGSPILHRFTGVREATIKAALLALGPTAREKRMLEKMEAERKAAEAEAARQEAERLERERRRRSRISADFRRCPWEVRQRRKLYKNPTFWPKSYTSLDPKYLYKRGWRKPGGLRCAFSLETCRKRDFYIFLGPPAAEGYRATGTCYTVRKSRGSGASMAVISRSEAA